MAKHDENKQEHREPEKNSIDAGYPAPLGEAPDPDAKNYRLQPSSYPIPAAFGVNPEMRFMEEAHKDEASGSVEAHPEENQPAMGVTEDGQPDTSGRTLSSRS